jgi:serine protease Do
MMKSKTHTRFPILAVGAVGVFSLLGGNAVLAIEPAPDNSKPPAALLDQPGKIDEAEAKLPFIGVVTASLPEMVADHVNLKHGIGLIVRTVMPESPAALAGLKPNDIILKVNETAVNEPEAFSAKIRSFKIGDKLSLKTIQKGAPAEVAVTLAERPADAIAVLPNEEPLLLEGVPDGQAMRLRDLIERNLGQLGENGLEEMLVPDPRANEQLQMLRERLNQAMGGEKKINPEQAPDVQFQQKSTIRMMDHEGSVEIKSSGENAEVVVRNKANEIVWSGPWDTEQDKAAAPDDIRERIEKLNIQKGKGFSLRLGR